ncbi:MAG: hypothetical protein GF392_05775 [Candidatus Omnitrophica bacterium]|nr:hypothetical protein [Candidatus Omnitrophota bacterium]
MEITEVRVFPAESRDGKLKAFATMTFDNWFVVRNLKIIQGSNGLFVAMPSRKVADACPRCRHKNTRGSQYCNGCGTRLSRQSDAEQNEGDRSSDHMDIAHPITQECRVYIQDRIIDAYERENGDKKASTRPEETLTALRAGTPADIPTGQPMPADGLSGEGAVSAPEVEEGRDIEL